MSTRPRAWSWSRPWRIATVGVLLLVVGALVVVGFGSGDDPPSRPAPTAIVAGTGDGLAPTAAERREARRLRETARDLLGEGRRDGLESLDVGGAGDWAWRALLVIGIAVAALVAVGLARRGPRRRVRPAQAATAAGSDVAVLEQRAADAEARGEHRAAVVLRFRAGTLRLLARGVLRPSAARTAGQVARAVPHPAIGALAAGYDRAAYGSGAVGPDDSRVAREGWSAVLAEPELEDAS